MNYLKRGQMEEINHYFNKTNELYETWAKNQGLSYNAMMILYSMDSDDSCSQKSICNKWLIPKQTVSTILGEYKKMGYVSFLEDPQDKRGKLISLTAAGHSFADPILHKLYAIEESILEKMGPELTLQMIETSKQYCEYFKQEVQHE